MVCEGDGWPAGEPEGAGLVLEGGGVIWLDEEDELMAGGGGRPGVDLIGGGRRGRSFTLEGLERTKRNEDASTHTRILFKQIFSPHAIFVLQNI